MRIAIIGTLDTKGLEVAYVRDVIVAHGAMPVVIDPGTLGQPAITPDVSREEIALAGGVPLPEILARHDKGYTQQIIIAGLVNVVSRLYAEGGLDGVIAVGGAQGTAIATAAMRALPVGVPKVMVSTIACGTAQFGPYVGTKDVTLIHSVADILGLNQITRRVLAQAAVAVVAMAAVPAEPPGERPLIAITQAGVTTRGVMAVKDRLEARGCEVIAFHCNGIGSQAMEELVREGAVRGVIDFSPHDITDLLFNGLMPAPPDRLQAPGEKGIPLIVIPGCADIRLHGVGDPIAEQLRDRPAVKHSPIHLHIRTTREEMAAVGRFIAERLNAGNGPSAVMVPLRGFSMLNRAGESLYDEDANMGFLEAVRSVLRPPVRLVEVDAHINDPEFADAVVTLFAAMVEAKAQPSAAPQVTARG